MTEVLPECVTHHKKPVFVLIEPRTRTEVRFQNPESLAIEEIDVDGCVFKDTDVQRCDYLVNIEDLQTSIFVELKGRHHPERALPQLISAHRLLKDKCKKTLIWLICRLPPIIPNTRVDLERARQAKVGIILEMRSSKIPYILKSPSADNE